MSMERKRAHLDAREDVCHEPLVRQRVSLINSSSSEENLRSQDEDEKSNGGKVGCSGGEDMYPLRIYTDGLHKREQRKLNNQEVARRNVMLAALNPFIKSFNTGDFETLVGTIQTRCESDIALRVEEWRCQGNGRKDMLGFWCLLHEIFPDAILNILERRLRSSLSDQQLRCVDLVADPSLVEQVSATDLTDLVSKHFAQVDPSHFQEQNCTYIIEIVLTFSDGDIIQNMFIQMLASSVTNV